MLGLKKGSWVEVAFVHKIQVQAGSAWAKLTKECKTVLSGHVPNDKENTP